MTSSYKRDYDRYDSAHYKQPESHKHKYNVTSTGFPMRTKNDRKNDHKNDRKNDRTKNVGNIFAHSYGSDVWGGPSEGRRYPKRNKSKRSKRSKSGKSKKKRSKRTKRGGSRRRPRTKQARSRFFNTLISA
jgi:hypothetical protein